MASEIADGAEQVALVSAGLCSITLVWRLCQKQLSQSAEVVGRLGGWLKG